MISLCRLHSVVLSAQKSGYFFFLHWILVPLGTVVLFRSVSLMSRKRLAHNVFDTLPHMPVLLLTSLIVIHVLGTKWQHSWSCFGDFLMLIFDKQDQRKCVFMQMLTCWKASSVSKRSYSCVANKDCVCVWGSSVLLSYFFECLLCIGRFSEAGLLELMRFVIFRAKSHERSQRTSGPISE